MCGIFGFITRQGEGPEMARLRRSCYRLYWLDPLASQAGFAPEVAWVGLTEDQAKALEKLRTSIESIQPDAGSTRPLEGSPITASL